MVNFVGAGTGAVDLITVRGKNLLEQADVVIYAGSLVNPELLKYTKTVSLNRFMIFFMLLFIIITHYSSNFVVLLMYYRLLDSR